MSSFEELLVMLESIKIDRSEINELKKQIDLKINRISKDTFKATDKDKKLLNPKVKEKLADLIYVCRTTDDYSEYTKARKELCELTGLSSRKIIRPGTAGVVSADNGYIHVGTIDKKESRKTKSLPPGTKLYHTSRVPGLTELKPTFRAGSLDSDKINKITSEDAMYPSKRVYFFIGNPGSRYTTDNSKPFVAGNNEYVYQYMGSVSNVKYDTEDPKGKSVYIETNRPVPVKDVTDQFKSVKESFDDGILTCIIESLCNECISYDEFIYLAEATELIYVTDV